MNERMNEWLPAAFGEFLLLVKSHVDLIAGHAVKLDYSMLNM